MENKTDHDLLIQLCTDVCWLKKVMGNHIKHHWMLTVALAAAAVAALLKWIL